MTRGMNLALLGHAQDAVEYLIDHHGFVECSKNEFAAMMGWVNPVTDKPERRWVEDICNLTRDQHLDPVAAEILGGYVIAYAPSKGGMTLIDPAGEQGLDQLLHILTGDMQRQQANKTINRRRLPTWRATGDNAANNEDMDLARLCYQAENEISSTGFVSDSIVAAMFQAMRVRGLMETT